MTNQSKEPLDLSQLEGHTEGAWKSGDAYNSPWTVSAVNDGFIVASCVNQSAAPSIAKSNARLIASAPTLLAEVKALREENKRYVHALRVIANTKIHIWTNDAHAVKLMGDVALEALKGTTP